MIMLIAALVAIGLAAWGGYVWGFRNGARDNVEHIIEEMRGLVHQQAIELGVQPTVSAGWTLPPETGDERIGYD